MTEHEIALLEGEQIAASDAYFGARPQIDTRDRRNVYEAGFRAAWKVGLAKLAQQEPKIIGWRTENFLWETSDINQAKNWEPNIGVLPIFEGDKNTNLAAPQPAPMNEADDKLKAMQAELKAISKAIDDPRTDLTHTPSEVITEIKQQLAAVTRQRDKLFDHREALLIGLAASLDRETAVTRQRDELRGALNQIADTACGEASHQYVAASALDQEGTP